MPPETTPVKMEEGEQQFVDDSYFSCQKFGWPVINNTVQFVTERNEVLSTYHTPQKIFLYVVVAMKSD